MISEQFVIINKHTGRFPCVAKDRYCEFDSPKSKAIYATASAARMDISNITREAKKEEANLKDYADDWAKEVMRMKSAYDIRYTTKVAKQAAKKLREFKKRDFAVVKITMEYVK